jgi:hypothetical protein
MVFQMDNPVNTDYDSKTPKRPFGVTLLAWLVLIMALLGWFRFFEVIRQWTYLQTLTPAPPVLYIASSGLVLGVLGAVLVWGLVLGRPWAPRLMQFAILFYSLYYWFDRLIVAIPAAIATRWPFALAVNIFFLLFTFWVLSRPKTQLFFRKE